MKIVRGSFYETLPFNSVEIGDLFEFEGKLHLKESTGSSIIVGEGATRSFAIEQTASVHPVTEIKYSIKGS